MELEPPAPGRKPAWLGFARASVKPTSIRLRQPPALHGLPTTRHIEGKLSMRWPPPTAAKRSATHYHP